MLVPDSRRFGHVNVVCSRYCPHVWTGRGKKRTQARGLKMGQLTLSMGPAREEVCFFVQRATIPIMKVLFFSFINATHTINIVYMLAMLYD